jgi:hypothetical protein
MQNNTAYANRYINDVDFKSSGVVRTSEIEWDRDLSYKIITASKKKKINLSALQDIKSVEKNDKPDSQVEYQSKSVKKSTPIPTQTIHQLPTIPTPQTSFWCIIDRFNWCDKDERKIQKKTLQRIGNMDCAFVLNQIFGVYLYPLQKALSETCIFDSMPEIEHNNIMVHIIMKGKTFYEGIIENPIISLYLCENYYPAYDWLTEFIK